jgi:hypothetical protein
LPDTKPLRWSFLLAAALVVPAIWAVVLLAAFLQREQLVDELAHRVEHGSEDDAVAALEQLTRLPNPPLVLLAKAAASPSRSVARQAQDSLNELLRKWRTRLQANRGTRRDVARLEQLAAALDNERESIAALDYPWLAKTTESILRIANAAPAVDAIDLALHCESLLDLTVGKGIASTTVVPAASAAIDHVPETLFDSPSRGALETLLPPDGPPRTALKETAPPSNFTAGASAAPLRAEPLSPAPRSQSRAERGKPDLKFASPIPVVDGPVVKPAADPWSQIASRSMLERWVATPDGNSKNQLERELQKRGFGSLRSDLVRVALSNDTPGRLQLINDLTSTPGVGAKAWLALLAEDANADVRLAAVTLMATSNDNQLLEKAWQVALHDQDPRIASLAEQLRDRHALSKRR